MVKLPLIPVNGEISAKERFALHVAIGLAERHANLFPPQEYAPFVEESIRVLRRLGIWNAD